MEFKLIDWIEPLSKINKLEKFAQNKLSRNVIEPGKPWYEKVKGNWASFFQNSNPLTVELACGWGEYTLALARKFPDRNFIGVDIKGDRIWRASQHAIASNLSNVAFLRTHIVEILNLFETDEVDEIWLTFPDPQPKDRNEKHRLTTRSFLMKYQQILHADGWFRFKTDNTALFEYTLQVLADFEVFEHEFTVDLYRSALLEDHYGIQTKYEKIWTTKGETIKYMKFRF